MIFFYILDFLSRVNMMVLRRDLWPACFFAKNKFFGNTHAASNTQQMLVTSWEDWKLQHPPPVFVNPQPDPQNAQQDRDIETARRNHRFEYQNWCMRSFRQILRNLIVDQSTPDMQRIIENWWHDCPPQGKAESAASYIRRVIQLRGQYNHFADLKHGNPANCLLFLGTPPRRNTTSDDASLVAADDGLDWAPDNGDLMGVNIVPLTDKQIMYKIYNGARQPATLTTYLAIHKDATLDDFTAHFKMLDDLQYKSNEGKQSYKKHKSNTMVATVSRGRGNKGGRGRGGKGKGRGRSGNNATGTGVCFHYQKHGTCKFGDNCKFLHQAGTTTDGAALTITNDTTTKEWVLANKATVLAMFEEEEKDSNGDTFTMAIFIRSIEIDDTDAESDGVNRLLIPNGGKQCIVVLALPNATDGKPDIMLQVLLDTGSDADLITKDLYNKHLADNTHALLGVRAVNKNLVVANGNDFRCEKIAKVKIYLASKRHAQLAGMVVSYMPDGLQMIIGMPTLVRWGAMFNLCTKPATVTFKNINNVTLSVTGRKEPD